VPVLSVSAIKVLIDGYQEGHDALCVRDLDGDHIIYIQHLWDSSISAQYVGRKKTQVY
jgi:hypothetical protein